MHSSHWHRGRKYKQNLALNHSAAEWRVYISEWFSIWNFNLLSIVGEKYLISNLDVPVHDSVSCKSAIILVIGWQVKTYLALEGLKKRSTQNTSKLALLRVCIKAWIVKYEFQLRPVECSRAEACCWDQIILHPLWIRTRDWGLWLRAENRYRSLIYITLLPITNDTQEDSWSWFS